MSEHPATVFMAALVIITYVLVAATFYGLGSLQPVSYPDEMCHADGDWCVTSCEGFRARAEDDPCWLWQSPLAGQ